MSEVLFVIFFQLVKLGELECLYLLIKSIDFKQSIVKKIIELYL